MPGPTCHVSRLSVAPVKGLAVQHPTEVRLDPDGVPEDRRLFLLDHAGAVVTIRRLPRLTAVRARLDLDVGRLRLDLPGGPTVEQELTPSGPALGASLFGKHRAGHGLPGPVEEALSAYAGERLRLVLADRTGVGTDEGPVSLIGSASVAAAGTPTDAGSSTGDRYRMLLEVATDVPFLEDTWVGGTVRVGDVRLAVSHPLDRCVVINHHPVTGGQDWDGLRRLAARRGGRRLTLGVIATVVNPGRIRLHDPVVPLGRA